MAYCCTTPAIVGATDMAMAASTAFITTAIATAATSFIPPWDKVCFREYLWNSAGSDMTR